MFGWSQKYIIYLIILFLSQIPLPVSILGQLEPYEYGQEAPYGYLITDTMEGEESAGVLLEVDEPDKPAMLEARLVGETKGFSMRNTYDSDYLSRDVVGMAGVPIDVSGNISNRAWDVPVLVFVYDESELECEEEDLGILWYNIADNWYETVTEYTIDYEKNQVSVPVKRLGTYILEDMEIWESVWNGTYVYEEPEEPDCHWHLEFAFWDIESLADTSLYDGSGEYHITTVEQLAGLVKLVNEGNSFSGCNFYLDANLDLEGYDWAPIGWYYPADDGHMGKDHPFEGKFYGNGHAIYNMRIIAPNESDLGMFGRTLQGFEVHDLALIDCYIQGKYYVGGIVGDNINFGEEYNMTNCFVTGTVKGKSDVGALVGSSAYLKIKDCAAVMEDGSTTELTGDLRGGYIMDCYINDTMAEEMISGFVVAKEAVTCCIP